jgi:hypothetical protein
MESSDSATATFSAMGYAMLWFDDTARNSNLLPVKANGLVRLRSLHVASGFGSTRRPCRARRRAW